MVMGVLLLVESAPRLRHHAMMSDPRRVGII
jgi:hypothetical protein